MCICLWQAQAWHRVSNSLVLAGADAVSDRRHYLNQNQLQLGNATTMVDRCIQAVTAQTVKLVHLQLSDLHLRALS